MSLDFIKILDVLKLSNSQLKMILVISLSLLFVIYPMGKKNGELETKITSIETSITAIKKTQVSTHNEVLGNRIFYVSEISKEYKELLNIQNTDNEVFNNKINLLMKYSVKYKKDRDNLETIFEIIDKDRNADILRAHNDNTHNGDTIN